MNKALVFKKTPQDYPNPGEHLVVEPASYSATVSAPENGVILKSLYTSFDPYMRGRMGPAQAKSYVPAFQLNRPIQSTSIAEIVKSDNPDFKTGDLVIGQVPIQEYIALESTQLSGISPLSNPLGIEDIRVFLGALGMPGLTAYSSLYEIGKPKSGETIFVSAASGAVGQLVGQLALREGLQVIGSVGSDEKLAYITDDLGFHGGFNYKKESPAAALARLAPHGIDIYYENVGDEHLQAALDAFNNFGRVVVSGMISQYNSAPFPITNIHKVISKRLTLRGFIFMDPGFADKYSKEHQTNLQKWIKDGSIKTLTHETIGIDQAADGLVGIFHGKNFGKAVLKF
ncbi:putative oxidoreductase [Ilyonectria destructans]|nr:putative oxidoreductase [Ilyonectria destructans]